MTWKERYKKTFLPTQLVILGVCAVLMIYYKMPLIGILAYLVVMELGELFGAMWTSRLVGKFEKQHERNNGIDLKVL
jgi:hypothetical protein